MKNSLKENTSLKKKLSLKSAAVKRSRLTGQQWLQVCVLTVYCILTQVNIGWMKQ